MMEEVQLRSWQKQKGKDWPTENDKTLSREIRAWQEADSRLASSLDSVQSTAAPAQPP